MIIRMTKLAMGPEVSWPIGHTQSVDDETGQMFIDAGAAERVDTPPVTVHVDSGPDAEPVTDDAGAPGEPDAEPVTPPRKKKSTKV